MSVVLVDVPVVEATLLTGSEPRMVQVVVSGLTAGQQVVVTAVTSAGVATAVPGGSRVSAGTQLVLTDNRAPLRTVVRYRATVDGVPYLSDEVVVAYAAGTSLVQSLDGQTVAQVAWVDTGDERELALRSVTFDVPGRGLPPARFVPAGVGGGEFVFDTWGASTAAMESMLASGRPLVLRTSGILPGVAPVVIFLPLRATNRLSTVREVYGDTRRWSIPYLLVADPEPSQALAGVTWADLDAAMASRTGADFDDLFEFSTGADLDSYDWRQLL